MFEEDLDQVIDVLHGAKRADPAQPVLVAGDPSSLTRRERLREDVPIPDDLMDQLRAGEAAPVCRSSSAYMGYDARRRVTRESSPLQFREIER